ncbi:MAG: hypothetical protein QF858_02480 [Candidatus Pacebacteria bacterium]|jgi:hypothetical protein|nr:hypothetical protein [Candidatus Paceibacterota bacterium]|tara:strand:- start:66 stop:1289 length:1224 start_codon:yes stop_codon:yes gene_type:complete
MKDNKDKGEWSEIWFTCPELTYYDLTVEEKDLNSIEKISDAISNVVSGGESDSTAHLVLGKLGHYKQEHSSLDYLEMDSSDVDISDFTTENKGRLIENPKKGEVVFVYFYYYDHAYNVLTKNENFKNISFEFKSFKDEAVLTGRDYSGFDLTLNDASGGGEHRLEIIYSNGQTFRGTPEDEDELIEEFHDYLTGTEEREAQEGDIAKKENGVLVSVQMPFQSELEDWVDEVNDTSFEDGSYTQEAKDWAIARIESFVDDFKEKAEAFFGEKILIGERIILNIEGKEDLHELDEKANTIEVELGDYDETRIYILLINEISADDLNGVFLSMDDYGFYATFPSNGELIEQGYDEGEYDTGYFNMDDNEGYICGHVKEDGGYKSTARYEEYNPFGARTIKTYNKVVKILK